MFSELFGGAPTDQAHRILYYTTIAAFCQEKNYTNLRLKKILNLCSFTY
nr:MAG TPA: hypothetical protein [Caudoviricetes sp.]